MAEEDLIFGKNRHLFGGIAPSNMIQFRCISKAVTSGATNTELNITLPNDTIIDGQTLCTVAGVVIRKKIGSYPEDEFDGDLVQDIKADGGTTHIISLGTISDTPYFSAFPYSTQGVYNRNKINRCKRLSDNGYLYGFDLDMSDSNPETCVTYPEDVDNYNWIGASLTNTGTFMSNGWSCIDDLSDFMPKPCILSSSGVVLTYLNPEKYTQTDSGSDTTMGSFDYDAATNAMMEWPKIYTHREVVDNVYKFRCSDKKIGDDWDCWCNYDGDGNEIDHFYTGIYLGTTDSNGTLRSVRGQTPTKFTTVDAMKTAAWKNNSGYTTEVIVDRLLIEDLLIMVSKSTNKAYHFGYGKTSSGTERSTGYLDNGGLFATETNRIEMNKVFGMEDFWSHRYRYVSGLECGGGVMNICTNVKAGGDHQDTIAIDYGTKTSGYFSKTIVRPYGRLPYDPNLSGSSTTYDCTQIDKDSSVYVRPAYYKNSESGASSVLSIAFANSTSIYATLSCKPYASKGGQS